MLQATSIASSAAVASWVTNWPERTVSVPIHAFRFDGHLHVALSTREVFVNTCGVFAAFLLLGLAANYYFRRLPLLALDQALRQLNAKQEETAVTKGRTRNPERALRGGA